MTNGNQPLSNISGGCLCGGVRYQISGPRRDIIDCHCENCRRTHGNFAAYTSVRQGDIRFLAQESLTWYHDTSPDAWRGFCHVCGGSLFWDGRNNTEKIAVSAGSLDPGHGLKTIGHVYVSEAGEYYQINDDLPQYPFSNHGELESET